MRSYIDGYYCRDSLHLQLINKDSNRKILDALKEAYPAGLTVEGLAKKTKLPIKTIYAQKAELYREFYVNHLEEEEESNPPRGRPRAAALREEEALRKRVRVVIEDASGVHDQYEGRKPVPLPPGNVVYSEGFTNAWHKIVENDEEQLCRDLLAFIQRIFGRIKEKDYGEETEEIIRKWEPERTIEFCCTQCGLNHEARDFIRAVLLHLIDRLEKYDKFIDFLKDNQFLTQEAYDTIINRRTN